MTEPYMVRWESAYKRDSWRSHAEKLWLTAEGLKAAQIRFAAAVAASYIRNVEITRITNPSDDATLLSWIDTWEAEGRRQRESST